MPEELYDTDRPGRRHQQEKRTRDRKYQWLRENGVSGTTAYRLRVKPWEYIYSYVALGKGQE